MIQRNFHKMFKVKPTVGNALTGIECFSSLLESHVPAADQPP